MAEYQILVQVGSGDDRREAGAYPLAEPSAKRVRALRRLQVDTTYYTEAERIAFIEEMRWEDEWIESVRYFDKDGNPTTKDAKGDAEAVRWVRKVKEPGLDRFAFMDRATQLLFPTAPIAGNEDWIDYEQAEEALGFFCARFERKSSPQTGFSL